MDQGQETGMEVIIMERFRLPLNFHQFILVWILIKITAELHVFSNKNENKYEFFPSMAFSLKTTIFTYIVSNFRLLNINGKDMKSCEERPIILYELVTVTQQPRKHQH